MAIMPFKFIQGHPFWYQMIASMHFLLVLILSCIISHTIFKIADYLSNFCCRWGGTSL